MQEFFVTVDLVVLTILDGSLNALVVKRKYPPFEGSWALPGGYVTADEDLLAAAYRELEEETNLREGVHLEQLATYGAPGRDPRGSTVTIAWLALLPSSSDPSAGTDASDAAWRPVTDFMEGGLPLAFDHAQILADGVERARAKLEYSPLAAAFCPPEFTVGQLRAVYEAVWGAPIDPRNFHRKVTHAPGFLEPTSRTSNVDGGRPARLYRRGTLDLLNPPITRATTGLTAPQGSTDQS